MRHVNQSPRLFGDMRHELTAILREHGFAINQLIGFNHEVVLTADLPAAAAEMNGTILIEDAGTDDVNLIVYAKGQRYRIDGGAPF